MPELVKQLREMARYEHDDLSIGDDAADEIERLRAALKGKCACLFDDNHVLRVMDLEDLKQRAQKVVDLAKLMDNAFDARNAEAHLLQAIMCCLADEDAKHQRMRNSWPSGHLQKLRNACAALSMFLGDNATGDDDLEFAPVKAIEMIKELKGAVNAKRP